MPSNLRLQLDTQSTQSYFPHPAASSPPAKKQRMSLSQTYRIASTARGKLGREAARGDHDLRLLVGHANLLDSLMVELANAEREQEAWFNENLRNQERAEAKQHIQWFDSISEETEEGDFSDDDSETDSDVEVDDFPVVEQFQTRRRSVSPPPPPAPEEFSFEDEFEGEDMEDDEEHALERIPSHTPELVHSSEDSEDSDDDSLPASPAGPVMQLDGKSSELSDYFQQVPQKLIAVQENFLQSHNSPMISAY